MVLLCACGEAQPPPEGAGNLVLVVVDTLRADAVVGRGGEVIVPGLRELARDGVVFQRAFSHSPMTLPSHTALFSSTLPHANGVMANGDRIPDDLPLLAEWLSRHGYATTASVSIFSLYQWSGHPRLARGFDRHDQPEWWVMASAEDSLGHAVEALDRLRENQPFFLFLHMADPHDPYRDHGQERQLASASLDGEPLVELDVSGAVPFEAKLDLEPGRHELELRSDRLMRLRYCQVVREGEELEVRMAGDSIETKEASLPNDQPVRELLLVFEVPEGEAAPIDLRLWLDDNVSTEGLVERYHGEVEYADDALATLLEQLQARGLYDDTVIVFTSDHGEGLGEHDHWVHATNVYDELLHVPLVVKPRLGDPRFDALSDAAGQLVRLVDVTPTILDLLGLPPLPGQMGTSVLQPAERLLLAETHPPFAPESMFCIRDDGFKLIYEEGSDSFELYDLVEDPDELEDLSARMETLRPGWSDTLRAIASGAARDSDGSSPLLDEVRAELEALGYTGK